MDITSNNTPMLNDENKNSSNKEERKLNNEDLELQALIFYYLKKRIDLNETFNPTIDIISNKQGEKKESKESTEIKKEDDKQEYKKKKDINDVKNYIKRQHKIEEEKEERKGKGNKSLFDSNNQSKALSKESKIFVTEINAFDPEDRTLKTWSGPNIIANSEEEAEFLIQNTGLGYCKVIGELAGLIDTDGNDVKNAYRDN